LRGIDLTVGDLSALPADHAVDAIVVSAFPDNYLPTSRTVIGALERKGISLSRLAQNRAVDLRQFSSCWLSHAIDQPEFNFKRVLCFEPAMRNSPTELVGDIFRSVIPFTAGNDTITRLAMPLVGSGDRGEDQEEVLDALVQAAVQWLSTGMPLERITIVLHESADIDGLTRTFTEAAKRHTQKQPSSHEFQFDAFVSYSWEDKHAVDQLVGQLQKVEPQPRLFVDRLELRVGAAWQRHIFESLDASRKVICVYSPAYLRSRVCQEEFNMALLRHRESDDGVLLPVYLQTANLPTYMKLVQYHDAREGDETCIAVAAESLITHL